MHPPFRLTFTCLWLSSLPLSASDGAEKSEAAGPSNDPRTELEAFVQTLGISITPTEDSLVLGGQSAGGKLVELAQPELLLSSGQTLPLSQSDLIALSGGEGAGRVHRAFFKDGTVLTGQLKWRAARFKADQLGAISLTPDAMALLILRAEKPAKPPLIPPGQRCIALDTGDRLVTRSDSDVSASFSGSWGTLRPPLERIRHFWSTHDPAPRTWLELTDGSRWHVWNTNWTGTVMVQGQSISINDSVRAISDTWAGLQRALSVTGPPPRAEVDTPSITLLDGSQLPWHDASKPIEFRDSTTNAEMKRSDFAQVTRLAPLTPPLFEFEDAAGRRFIGNSPHPALAMDREFPKGGVAWHLVRTIQLRPAAATQPQSTPAP